MTTTHCPSGRRRFHRAEGPTGLGLTLTGTHVTAWSREAAGWVARARHDLREESLVGEALPDEVGAGTEQERAGEEDGGLAEDLGKGGDEQG